MNIYKRYIIFFLFLYAIISVLYVIIYNVFLVNGLSVSQLPYKTLYDHQYKKSTFSDAEIIFVGDSSLGNAINSELFSKLSGINSQNLALTGKSGYRGSLELIQKTYQNNPDLKRVVIMQTLGMMKRPIASEYKEPVLYFKSNDFRGVDLSIYSFNALKLLFKALEKPVWNNSQQATQIKNDYVAQTRRLNYNLEFPNFTPQEINLHKTTYLKKIKQFCQKTKLTCYYSHGPIIKKRCENSTEYILSVNKIITEIGLTVIKNTPICIPLTEIGDSDDHVHPDFKDEYTRQYYEVLKSYLR